MATTHSPGGTGRALGPHTTVLIGADGGRYPAGNSVLVRGSSGTAIIDPSTSVVARGGADASVDQVVLSHAHEDHVAGVHLFAAASVHVHDADLQGIASLDGLMEMYGLDPATAATFRHVVEHEFTYSPRPDALGFADGHVIDLGGVTITVIHLPGHTRGHCGLLVEPDGVLFTGDIDLSAFGPYYGDAWSDLDSFERSLAVARDVEARWYVTFHHKGVVDGHDEFVAQLDAFTAVIARREDRMVEHLTAAPRTLDELVAHRFVYRPHVEIPIVDSVERRSATMSLARLVAAGRVFEVQPGRWSASRNL